MRYDSTRIVLLAHLMLIPRTLLDCGPSDVKCPPAATPHITDDTLHKIPSRIGSVGFRNQVTFPWNPDADARASAQLAIQQAEIQNSALTDEQKEIYAYSLRTDAEGAKAYRPIRIPRALGHPYDSPTGKLRSASFEDGPDDIDDEAAALRSLRKSPELSQAPLLPTSRPLLRTCSERVWWWIYLSSCWLSGITYAVRENHGGSIRRSGHSIPDCPDLDFASR